MKESKIIYSLSVEDIQTVAVKMIERKFNKTELKSVIDKLPDSIPWLDRICSTLMELKLVTKEGD